jgi:flagellar biosynthesis GTPase FlhF
MVQHAAPAREGDDKEVVARFDLPAGLLEGKPSTAEKAPAVRPASRAVASGRSQVLDEYPVSTLDLVKYAIFIIDCNRATVLVQSKPSGLEELKFRCVEAMGLRATEESVRMELIFAGYDGPERAPLYTDQQLESFLSTLPQDETGQSKGDAAVQAALAMQKAEYEKIIRELNDKIEDLTDVCRKLKQRNAELEEDAEKMVEQMKLRLEQAEVDIEKRCRKEFKKLLAQKEAEWKARIDELRRKLSDLKKMYEAEVEKVAALQKEVDAVKKTARGGA